MFFEVIPTEPYRNGGGALTYSSDVPLLPGHIVLIPLGKRTVTGVVLRRVPHVKFPTKPISRLLHPFPLPQHLLSAAIWLSDYYLSPLTSTINLMVPAGLAARTVQKLYSSPITTDPSPLQKSRKSPKTAPAPQNSSLSQDPSSPQNIPKTPFSPQTTSRASLSTLNSQPAITPTSTPSTTLESLSSTSNAKKPFFDQNSPSIPLNSAQQNALRSLQKASEGTSLLRGVTGSGKTNIYLTLAANALKNQKSAILLVPEIALTSQLVKIFTQTFGNRVTLIHSGQTLTERRQIWLNIQRSTAPEAGSRSLKEDYPKKADHLRETKRAVKLTARSDDPVKTGVEAGRSNNDLPFSGSPLIVIGPRSALLTPIHNLGLIMVDEAHEAAYYQENTPRYSTLRLASTIAKKLHIPCIFGSATPNIVDYHLAKSRNSLVELSTKAKSTAIKPKVSVIDLKDRNNFTKNRYFSDPLLTDIQKNLQDKHQTLIFHNRRGSAPLTLCEACGWQALCPECFLPMTLHTDDYTLCCHVCGNSEKVPTSCPNCHKPDIIHKGFGTKLLESELTRIFPEAKIARFDGDNKKSNGLASLYNDVKSGEIQILIGTQTLARGLDLPHLATVGIIQADSGLALPDFAAEERTFELLTQVIGRVGRGHLDTARVFVQTFQPDHPVVQTALKSDFPSFADYLLKHRRQQNMPPFTHLARLSVTYKTEKTTLTKIKQAHADLSKTPGLKLSPSLPAFHERTSRGFTWQIIIKSTSRNRLREALIPFALNNQFSITLDPPSLL